MGVHLLGLLSVDHLAEVGDDLAGVVVLNGGGVTSTNTIGSVDQHHGNHGHVVLGLDGKPIVVEVVEQRIVVGVEDGP